MHDDLVPEERDQAYNQLLALLRSSSQKRVPIEATEQAQIIARVWERLVQTDLGASLNGNLPVPQPGVLDSSPHQAESPAGKPRHDRRRLRSMALLAAAVIVAVLLGTAFAPLGHQLLPRIGGYNQATKTPAGLPTLTLFPNVATIGSTIQLTLKNFKHNGRVVLTLDRQIRIPIDGGSNIIVVSPAGSANVDVTIESDWGTGSHVLVAEDLTTRYIASATLLITGSATQTYDSFVATNGIMFGFDAQHTHFNPFEHMLNPTTVGGLTKKWTYSTGSHIISSPAVAGGVVYVGISYNHMYALDAATGKIKWAYSTGASQVNDSPAVVGGVVYVGSSEDHTLYALDAATGKKKWAYQTRGPIISSPAVVGGVVYVGSEDGNVYALDAASGTKKWAYHIGHYIDSSPAVAGGVVYVGSDDGNVYALDAASGAKKWAYRTGDVVYSSPAVVGGAVYVGSDDGNVYALDAASGAKKWAYQTGSSAMFSPTVANGVVYVGSNDRNVYALDATSGAKKWIYRTGFDVESSPAVADGVVYVGAGDGNVYAFHLPGT